ncbi:transcriptional regulator/sugar kinase [Desulfosporosinus acidiphilus SJ4]|uniref:Transcriptional regulator/sugar kinase n=1 Tax=Desulfosporosinus acidiphilus (strain DSM 22704 / JCM 16185 / SJ4) TaxID=646529 RepID=I4D2Q2_DESAJ|nr:ROK family transcriptional regulator [Desulfosporosinus acidiphilus]AFM40076.1 transcriptional regulator/sugar kinase [Desulfosporosinus acidiphilus SJ4]
MVITIFSFGNIGHDTIKDSTAKRILKLLYTERQLTKQEIAQQLGLSIPTVISNVNELIEEGLLEEAGVAGSTGGRKPVIIRCKPKARYSFGVDINPTEGRVILTDLDNRILADERFSIAEVCKDSYIVRQVFKITQDMICKNNLSLEKVLGVGFSLPGTVDEEKMLLLNAPNLGITNVSFKNFSEILSMPVYIENEANAAAFAESSLEAVKNINNLVYISITKGIGTGIVIKGSLYKGTFKRAGEFGHMTIVANGKPCNCGREGCWEVYASERGLLDLYQELNGEIVPGISAIFEKIRRKEASALEVFDKYLDYLAIGIQNIILFLDPDYLILGGNITTYKDLYFEDLLNRVFKPDSLFKTNETKISFSKLEEDASILGASLLPLLSFFNDERIKVR